MATYTLSYTGAEVNSAIGNAKDLFSTVHTWTAEQSMADLSVTHHLTANWITVATDFVVNGLTNLNSQLIVSGLASFVHGVLIDGENSYLTVGRPSTFNALSTFNANVNIDADAYLNVYGTTNFYKDINFQPADTISIHGVKEVWCQEVALGRLGALGLTYSGTGVASATKPGVYITTSGLTTFSAGDAIPANALVITFYN